MWWRKCEDENQFGKRWWNNGEELLPSVWFCETVQKTRQLAGRYLWSFFDHWAIRWRTASKKGQPRTIYHRGRVGLGINDGIIWQACRGEIDFKKAFSIYPCLSQARWRRLSSWSPSCWPAHRSWADKCAENWEINLSSDNRGGNWWRGCYFNIMQGIIIINNTRPRGLDRV